MARITMKSAPTNTVEELYPSFLSAAAARGVKDKTLDTYKQHFRAISKRLDVSIPISELQKSDLDDMIFAMRESELSDILSLLYMNYKSQFYARNPEVADCPQGLSFHTAANVVN